MKIVSFHEFMAGQPTTRLTEDLDDEISKNLKKPSIKSREKEYYSVMELLCSADEKNRMLGEIFLDTKLKHLETVPVEYAEYFELRAKIIEDLKYKGVPNNVFIFHPSGLDKPIVEDGYSIVIFDNIRIPVSFCKDGKLMHPFHTIYGSFNIMLNKLNSLEGCPVTVHGDFNCARNNLENLVGGPRQVDGEYDCRKNKLITLRGAATRVGGDFVCAFNQLPDLQELPDSIGGDLYVSENPFEADFMETIESEISGKIYSAKVLQDDQP